MGALSADSSLVSAQAAFKIYLYHPLERLQFFIIIVPKWALSHAGPSPSILSPSRALSFLCHLPDYRELNREKGGGYWGGGPTAGLGLCQVGEHTGAWEATGTFTPGLR